MQVCNLATLGATNGKLVLLVYAPYFIVVVVVVMSLPNALLARYYFQKNLFLYILALTILNSIAIAFTQQPTQFQEPKIHVIAKHESSEEDVVQVSPTTSASPAVEVEESHVFTSKVLIGSGANANVFCVTHPALRLAPFSSPSTPSRQNRRARTLCAISTRLNWTMMQLLFMDGLFSIPLICFQWAGCAEGAIGVSL